MKQTRDTLTPEEFVGEIEANKSLTTATELKQLKEYARAWAVVFYNGEQPPELTTRIERLQNRWR